MSHGTKRKNGYPFTPSITLYVVELRTPEGVFRPTGILSLTPEGAEEALKRCTGGEYQIGMYKRVRLHDSSLYNKPRKGH